MTAATITTKPDGELASEHRVLTVSDGETFVSNLSNPIMAKLTQAETTTTWAGSAVNLSYALSSKTFTITYKIAGSAVTDKKVAISVYGRK